MAGRSRLPAALVAGGRILPTQAKAVVSVGPRSASSAGTDAATRSSRQTHFAHGPPGAGLGRPAATSVPPARGNTGRVSALAVTAARAPERVAAFATLAAASARRVAAVAPGADRSRGSGDSAVDNAVPPRGEQRRWYRRRRSGPHGARQTRPPSPPPHQGRRARSTFVSAHFELGPNEVVDYLNDHGITARDMHDSNEINAKTCPFCSPAKGRPDNLWKLYFRRDNGAFFCHRCGNKGSWFDFRARLSRFNDDGGVGHDGGGGGGADPWSPIEDMSDAGAAPLAPTYLPTIREELAGSTTAMAFLTEDRGLAPETLAAYGVGAATRSFPDPAGVWRDHECVVFPSITPPRGGDGDEGGGSSPDPPVAPVADADAAVSGGAEVIRAKIRAIEHKHHMRIEPKGGAWALFGMHLVPPDAREIVICEGEFDAMAVYQATGVPAVSLPNGARSMPLALVPQLERFARIVLWTDDDVPGQEGAEKIAHKLGLSRCYLVRSKGGRADGPKDANDALRAGLDLKAILATARRVPHRQIATFGDLRDEIYREVLNPLQVAGIQSKCMPGLNRVLKGHRRGEVSILTGPTGSGKTSILAQLSLDYAAQGVPTLWGSFELTNVRLAKKMLGQFAHKSLEANVEEFDSWAARFTDLPLYFLRFFGSTDVTKVIEAMDYAAYVYDVEHVVIDNLQFMLSGQGGRGFDKFHILDEAVEAFRAFATQRNVHVTLVVHPRKEADGVALNTASVFGTAKATQEADNVIILQKYPHYRALDVRKNRFDGTLGVVPYRFDPESGNVVELSDEEVEELDRQGAAAAGGHGGVGGGAGGGGGGGGGYRQQQAPWGGGSGGGNGGGSTSGLPFAD